ncbi:MAG: bifunctional hydroxymethylpyrimidine kinase/phosphomethylpyrimidine kinase, partial [Gammaproteobacteria bacterium]
ILVSSYGKPLRLPSRRYPTQLRGTGCALASAIAAGLARGLPLEYACRFGKNYLSAMFAAA